jgi:hypothetical protein
MMPSHLSDAAKPRNLIAFGSAMALLTGIGIASYQTGMGLNTVATGRQSGMPTLANLGPNANEEDKLKYLALATATTIPYGGFFIDRALGGGDAFDIAAYIPQLDLVRTASKEAEGAIKTGDWSQAFFDMANRFGGIYAGAVNRLPEMSERLEIKNSERVLRSAKSSGEGPTQPTRLLRSAQISAYSGNPGVASSQIEQAIQWQMKTHGLSRAQAMASVRASVMAQNPVVRATGRNLRGAELDSTLSRMTPSQLSSYQTGQRGFQNFRSALPQRTYHDGVGGHQIFKSKTFKPAKVRKFWSISMK